MTPFTGQFVANGYSVKPPMFYFIFQNENETLIVARPVYVANSSDAKEKYIRACALSHSKGFDANKYSLRAGVPFKGRTLGGGRTITFLKGDIGFFANNTMMLVKGWFPQLEILTTYCNIVFV